MAVKLRTLNCTPDEDIERGESGPFYKPRSRGLPEGLLDRALTPGAQDEMDPKARFNGLTKRGYFQAR